MSAVTKRQSIEDAVAFLALLAIVASCGASGAPVAAPADAAPAMDAGDAANAGDGNTGVDTAVAADVSVFVPPPTCVDSATMPPWRAGMAIGEWKQLASADITAVKPAVQPGGGYYGRIDAWNGFAADTVNSTLYLGGAGGHADYAGNEMYTLDLKLPAPQWVLQMQPSPSTAYTVDQAYYTDGKPSPTHTYYTAWFIEQRGKFFRFAGASTWGTGNGGTRFIDSWDPATKAWDPMGTNPTLGTRPIFEMPTAKDFLTGDVYQIQGDNRLYRWNQTANSVTDLGEAGGGSGSFYDIDRSAMVIDSASGRLVIFSDSANPGSNVRIYDLATKIWSVKGLTGPGAALATEKKTGGMGYYDFCARRVIIKNRQGATVIQVDPMTLVAAQFPTSGAVPPDAINGVHTLFQNLPRLGGYAYQPSHTAKLYFLATQ
jgi:hypothetical protein